MVEELIMLAGCVGSPPEAISGRCCFVVVADCVRGLWVVVVFSQPGLDPPVSMLVTLSGCSPVPLVAQLQLGG